MNKLVGWILSLTKLDVIVTPLRKFLSGKKVYLCGAGIAIPALVSILQGFSDMGVPYLMQLSHQPEYKQLLEGIAWIAGRAAFTKAVDPSKDPNASEQQN